MIAVIRIRTGINIRKEFKDTLKLLRLNYLNNCILKQENPSDMGMTEKVRDFVTYGEIDKDVLVELLKKRLRLTNDKKVDEKVLKQITGFDSFEKLAEELMSGKKKLTDFGQIRPFFRLTPPSKGFKSVKEYYPKGDLGYRGREINNLLKRMI